MEAHEEIYQWEKKDAVELLKQCGLVEGMAVLDLGCGYAHYTIPAAFAVGSKGNIIAIEKIRKIFKHAERRLKEAGIQNVKVMHTDHHGLPETMENQLDFLMMYDVIHHSPRHEMIEVATRYLKPGGIFSLLAFKDICGYKSTAFEAALTDVINDIEAELQHVAQTQGADQICEERQEAASCLTLPCHDAFDCPK